MSYGVFPAIPDDSAGCGQHEPADASEMERREREHPVTTREVPDPPLDEKPRPKLVT